jgi:hypothetical protein
MTLYDFIKLGEKERAEETWKGTFLSSRNEGEYKVILYKLESFYVEVYYNNELNKIHKLRPFKTTERLHQYFNPLLN